MSFAIYPTRTSHAPIAAMAPDPDDPRQRFREVEESGLAKCPQRKIVSINGSLFFGTANYADEVLKEIDAGDQKHLLIIGHGKNCTDVSGSQAP